MFVHKYLYNALSLSHPISMYVWLHICYDSWEYFIVYEVKLSLIRCVIRCMLLRAFADLCLDANGCIYCVSVVCIITFVKLHAFYWVLVRESASMPVCQVFTIARTCVLSGWKTYRIWLSVCVFVCICAVLLIFRIWILSISSVIFRRRLE